MEKSSVSVGEEERLKGGSVRMSGCCDNDLSAAAPSESPKGAWNIKQDTHTHRYSLHTETRTQVGAHISSREGKQDKSKQATLLNVSRIFHDRTEDPQQATVIFNLRLLFFSTGAYSDCLLSGTAAAFCGFVVVVVIPCQKRHVVTAT